MHVRKMISSASGAMNRLRAASHGSWKGVDMLCQMYFEINWYWLSLSLSLSLPFLDLYLEIYASLYCRMDVTKDPKYRIMACKSGVKVYIPMGAHPNIFVRT